MGEREDSGVAAGWLFADLALVLAVIFLAFGAVSVVSPDPGSTATDPVGAPEVTPAAVVEPSPAPSPPAVEAVQCAPGGTGEASAVLGRAYRCTANVSGAVDEVRWEFAGAGAGKAERGGSGAPTWRGTLTGAGMVTAVASGPGGAARRSVFVAAPPRPRGSVVVEFHFAQIVLSGASRYTEAEATAALAWDGVPRDALTKADEDAQPRAGAEVGEATAREFIAARVAAGFRIALVETFASDPDGLHVALARHVNDSWYAAIVQEMPDALLECEGARERWFADYRDDRLPRGEVRMNLFFVTPTDPSDCR